MFNASSLLVVAYTTPQEAAACDAQYTPIQPNRQARTPHNHQAKTETKRPSVWRSRRQTETQKGNADTRKDARHRARPGPTVKSRTQRPVSQGDDAAKSAGPPRR
eukprot:contig_12863_g3067